MWSQTPGIWGRTRRSRQRHAWDCLYLVGNAYYFHYNVLLCAVEHVVLELGYRLMLIPYHVGQLLVLFHQLTVVLLHVLHLLSQYAVYVPLVGDALTQGVDYALSLVQHLRVVDGHGHGFAVPRLRRSFRRFFGRSLLCLCGFCLCLLCCGVCVVGLFRLRLRGILGLFPLCGMFPLSGFFSLNGLFFPGGLSFPSSLFLFYSLLLWGILGPLRFFLWSE